tara:strand:+ start:344 stop:547 length:204 start_codon:yes stop_codon:yes gene_type:complete
MASYEKQRSKAEKKAKKRVVKTAKKALKGRGGKDVTDVVKDMGREQKELSSVFKPRIIIKGVYKEGE